MANARVKLAKTGHDPHSSTLVVLCVVRLLFVLCYVLFVYKCVLPPGDNSTAVMKYIISYTCSMKFSYCHSSGAKDFEKASIFLENLCSRPVWKSHLLLFSLSLHRRTASSNVRGNCNQSLFRTLVS
jgi:hypothetical protein